MQAFASTELDDLVHARAEAVQLPLAARSSGRSDRPHLVRAYALANAIVRRYDAGQ